MASQPSPSRRPFLPAFAAGILMLGLAVGPAVAQESSPAADGSPAAAAAPAASAASASEAAEGTITLYTSVTQDTVDAVLAALAEQHPGLAVEVFRAPTGELDARIASELRSGGIGADVLWVSDPLSLQRYDADGLLAALSSHGPRRRAHRVPHGHDAGHAPAQPRHRRGRGRRTCPDLLGRPGGSRLRRRCRHPRPRVRGLGLRVPGPGRHRSRARPELPRRAQGQRRGRDRLAGRHRDGRGRGPAEGRACRSTSSSATRSPRALRSTWSGPRQAPSRCTARSRSWRRATPAQLPRRSSSSSSPPRARRPSPPQAGSRCAQTFPGIRRHRAGREPRLDGAVRDAGRAARGVPRRLR